MVNIDYVSIRNAGSVYDAVAYADKIVQDETIRFSRKPDFTLGLLVLGFRCLGGAMSDVLLVLCTFPSLEQARQIGKALVERQLAACVNLVPGVESIYCWQGKMESAAEVLAIFKTSSAAFPEFQQLLTELHPYEVPEIMAFSPEKIAEPYRAWLLNNVALPDR